MKHFKSTLQTYSIKSFANSVTFVEPPFIAVIMTSCLYSTILVIYPHINPLSVSVYPFTVIGRMVSSCHRATVKLHLGRFIT